MSKTFVSGAITTARRAMVLSLVATAVVIGCLVVERMHFQGAIEEAARLRRDATRISGQILIYDERLTMSANMAAATGEQRWMTRYERHLPQIDAAIAEAVAISPQDIARRFEEETKTANDRLVDMERQAIAASLQGQLGGARDLLDSRDYAEQKLILEAGTLRFLDGLRASAEISLNGIISKANWLVSGIVLSSLVGFGMLWRLLSQNLSRSMAGYIHAEQRLLMMAMHDEMTGLPNRRAFSEGVSRMLAECEGAAGVVAIAMVDVDDFKNVNDTLGHHVGDELIRLIAQRLLGQLPPGGLLARFGGDELAIAVPGGTVKEARAALRRMGETLKEPASIDGQTLHITASGGIAFAPEHGKTVADLLRLADIALYRAKAAGRGQVRMFDPSMDAMIREKVMLESDLRSALAREQLELHYQPIMSGSDEATSGFEALLRWRHPEKGMISPAVFIPIAEQSDLIVSLGEWVLRRGFLDARHLGGLTVAINISPRHFRHPSFLLTVERLVAETGVDPLCIELEVTESLLMEESDDVRRVMFRLHAIGFQIALDDFGTGYSSLSYLRRFPFNKIKIDRSFIKSIETSREAAQIIHAMVSLSRALNMSVTAEGVETLEQKRFLQGTGCQQLQGFLFAKPMTRDEAASRIANARSQGHEPRAVA